MIASYRKFSCVYKITSIVNGKFYIGSAVCYETRKRHHLWQLRNGVHGNKYLQRHFDKYGDKDLIFSVIERVDKSKLIVREQFYLDTLKPMFNICKIADSTLGVPCSRAKKIKLRKIHKGRKATPASVEANRQGQLKRLPFSKKMRRNISLGLMGRKVSKKSVNKIRLMQRSRKQVLCITNGRTYPSIRFAAKKLHLNRITISRVCNGRAKTSGHMSFKFV